MPLQVAGPLLPRVTEYARSTILICKACHKEYLPRMGVQSTFWNL